MNIAVQLCGLLLLSVVLYFYLSCKKVFLNTESAFFGLIVTSIIYLTADVFSTVALGRMAEMPEILAGTMVRIHKIALLITVYYAILYVFSGMYGKSLKYKKIARMFAIYKIFQIIMTVILPMRYMDVNGNRTAVGAAVVFVYASIVSELIITIVALSRYSHLIDVRRKNVVTGWFAIWIAAMIAIIWAPGYITVSFTIAIGVLIIYIKLENPESAIDRETGLFNQNTFQPFLSQQYGNGRKFSLLMITAYGSSHVSSHDIYAFKQSLVSDLVDIRGTYAFKTNEDDFFIVYEDREAAGNKYEELCGKYIGEGYNVIKPYIIYLPDSDTAGGINELLRLIRWGGTTSDIAEKNCFVIDKNAADSMKQEIETGKLINEAMENDRVEVFYQPIYSTEKKYFATAEALVRIRDTEGKIIPPGRFIEVAEKNGSILRLGEIVFEKVCMFLETTDVTRYGIEYIEVNLSVIQCECDGLAEKFISIMKKHNITGSMINLEITESAAMKSRNRLIRNLSNLKKFGVGFSLDDFGTGQSNLNYIVDMPVDIVKFDRGMVNAYFESYKAKYVMNAAMHMIQGLQLDIVSEGIETEEQLKIMQELGIQYIQGYYFSKPLPEKECLEFLREKNPAVTGIREAGC